MDTASPSATPPGQPTPEVLQARSDSGTAAAPTETAVARDSAAGKKVRRSYRPSHRATFVGLLVVIAILAVNGVVIGLLLRAQNKTDSTTPTGQISVSKDVLDRVGVNQSAVGDSGVILTIAPPTEFKHDVTIGGTIAIGGQFNLNGRFTAADAQLTQLQAGKTSVNSLSVSGDTTLTTATVQNQLSIAGTTLLQGPVTVAQLLTINNSATVAGSLSVGGTVTAAAVTGRSLTTTSTLTISGHVITAGSAPNLTGGVGLGSNGTISISGNDAAGTVAVNVGAGGMSSGGIIASVTFRTPYANTPHVVVSPIGNIGTDLYITRSSAGFSIGVSSPIAAPGGYAFDYIVEQ